MQSLVAGLPCSPERIPHCIGHFDNPVTSDGLLASAEQLFGVFVLQSRPLLGPPTTNEVVLADGILLDDQVLILGRKQVRQQLACTLVFNVFTEETCDSSYHDAGQNCDNPR